MATPLPHVRVLWRPEQFNRCTNPGFESATTGWSVAAGINGAATSITRITSDAYEGSACGQLVTTTTAGSGVNYDLGSDTYFPEATYGAMYAATVWLKRVSGPRVCKLVLGSQGTSSERDEVLITDLADDWRPYRVVWSPRSSTVTDAQFAIVTVTDEALTLNIDSVSIYMPEGFSQVENGAFATTTGWTTDTGVTITKTTTDPYETGGAYARIDTTGGVAGADKVNYSLGTRTFTSGRTYRMRYVARHVSGTTIYASRFGEFPADYKQEFLIPSTTWTVYTVDWTPSSDTSDVDLQFGEANQGSGVFEVAHVEIYEASDELGADLDTLSYKAGARTNSSTASPGSFTLTVRNADGTYSPDNATSALVGSVEAGRAVLARADLDGTGYALFHGDIDNIEPLPFKAKASITGKDALANLGNVEVRVPFCESRSYSDARKAAFSQALSLGERTDPDDAFGTARLDLSTDALEGSTFFDGTSGVTRLASYLAALNDATGTLHYIEPHYDAGKPWTYKTIDRTALTANDAGTIIDEDFGQVDQYRAGFESLENRMRVSWQSYDELVLNPDESLGGTYQLIAHAIVRNETATYGGDIDHADPYFHYLDDRIGQSDEVQDGRTTKTRIETPWSAAVMPGRPRDTSTQPSFFISRTTFYPDAYVPMDLAAGDEDARTFTFSLPVADLEVLMYDDGVAADVVTSSITDPAQADVRWWAASATVVDFFALAGRPFIPRDSHEIILEDAVSTLKRGVHDGPSVSSYVPSLGAAEGIANYRTWRYGEPRTRFQVSETPRNFSRGLTLGLGDHATLSLDRWHVASLSAVVRAIEVYASADTWQTRWDFEELPTHTDFFTLDDSDKGLDDAVVLAY